MEKGIRLGGRQKGTSNKLTIETREKIKDFIDRDLDDFVNEFEELEIIDKMNVRKWIYSLGIPKERDVNLNVKEKNQLQGPMGELSRMTAAQMIKARPDLVKLMLDELKELEEKEQKPTC